MTTTYDRSKAPPPSAGLTAFAEALASYIGSTGDPDWISSVGAMNVLNVRGNVRTATRAWEREWAPYEGILVAQARSEGHSDADIARALDVPRQNLQRVHGTLRRE
jgi:hypothetical protein